MSWAGSGPVQATDVAFEDERESEESVADLCCTLSEGPFLRLLFFSGSVLDATQASR